LIYLPAIVSVTCWFKNKRSLATGIAVAGSGLGTFIFSPLTNHLIEEYGWRGGLLIIAALVFQCTTFGALFRPVEEVPSEEEKEQELRLMPRPTNGSVPIQRPLSVGNIPPVPLQNSSQLTVSLGCLTKPSVPVVDKRFHSQTLRKNVGVMTRSDVLYCGSFHQLPPEK